MLSLTQPAHSQPLHPSQTSSLVSQIHYNTFPQIIIPPQSHTPHLNTQDGYQRTTQRGTIANDHNIFFRRSDDQMYNNNWTTWWRWWVQLQLPGAIQLILNNQLQHPGTQQKEAKAQSTIDIWIGKHWKYIDHNTYRNAFKWKDTWLRDSSEEFRADRTLGRKTGVWLPTSKRSKQLMHNSWLQNPTHMLNTNKYTWKKTQYCYS